MLRNIWQDLRFGVRALARNPVITAIAALSLALGMGANTAIFSLIDTVMLRSLPVRDPQELVLLSDPSSSGVSQGSQGGVRSLFSFQEFQHLRDRQQVFSGMYAAESHAQRYSATIDGSAPENLRERLVTGSPTSPAAPASWAKWCASIAPRSPSSAWRRPVSSARPSAPHPRSGSP